jgi:DNA-binding CsgD family transcriptional regulator
LPDDSDASRPPQTRIYGTLTPREREILRAREDGATHASIARRFGLTISRVGQILQSAKRRLDILERARKLAAATNDPLDVPIELLPLSTRAVHGLRAYGKTTLRHVAATSVEELLQMKNLGPTSVREIIAVVRRHAGRR